MKELLTAIISGLTNFISALPTTLTVLVFILLATFFISYDWHRLAQKARKLLPNRVHGYGKLFCRLKKSFVWFCESTTYTRIYDNCHCTNRAFNITRTIRHYYRDYYRGCRFTTIFRTGAVFVPWVIYVFFTGDTAFAIGLLILYIVVIVQRQIMEPKVLSSNIGLDPLATLVALFVGFKLLAFRINHRPSHLSTT